MSDATARGRHADTETGTFKSGLRVSSSTSPRELNSSTRHKLTRLLLFKSAAEALLVFALAASFFYYTFASGVRGSIDDMHTDTSVSGWAIDEAEPAARVEVYLYIDSHFASSGLAGEPRPELVRDKSASDERHGFVFQLPTLTGGEHEASIYVLRAGVGDARRTLHLVGHPVRFRAMLSATITTDALELSREGAEER